jgi:dTDP-4-amino-4,6-dideoxygalactose transaminase
LDELQAAILRVRLKYLDADNAARRGLAAVYNRGLAGSKVIVPPEDPQAPSVYHQYVIRAPQRDGLRARLREVGIQALIHYPEAVHQQPAYQSRLPSLVSLANTEAVIPRILSLPMYPELAQESARLVATNIVRLVEEST